MKRVLAALLLLCAASGLAYAAFTYLGPVPTQPLDTVNHAATTTSPQVRSFSDCEAAGYPVQESNPRQCRTPDGLTFAEEIQMQPTYSNASADQIRVSTPTPGSVTGKSFMVTGEARGTWYFEASFQVEVLDKNGITLASVPAQAQSNWMTENFVPFSASITVPQSYIGTATLVLRKANASGLPERDASVSFPITIEY